MNTGVSQDSCTQWPNHVGSSVTSVPSNMLVTHTRAGRVQVKRPKGENPPAGGGCAHFKCNLPQNAQMCHLNRSRFFLSRVLAYTCWYRVCSIKHWHWERNLDSNGGFKCTVTTDILPKIGAESLKLLEMGPVVLKFVLMCFGKNVLVISLIVFQE